MIYFMVNGILLVIVGNVALLGDRLPRCLLTVNAGDYECGIFFFYTVNAGDYLCISSFRVYVQDVDFYFLSVLILSW